MIERNLMTHHDDPKSSSIVSTEGDPHLGFDIECASAPA